MFQAEIRHTTDDHAVQILVGEQRWRHGCGEDVHGRAADRVIHLRSIEQRLDRALPKLLPDLLVLVLQLVRCRMRGPPDAEAPQIIEAHFDAAVAPALGREEILLQTGYGSEVDEIAARLDSICKRFSAAVSAPVRNSHSARFSSSANVSSCRRFQQSASNAVPTVK